MNVVAVFLNAFIGWLAAHQTAAYGILFGGMFFETLIGLSFFIPGELFLIPGAILAGRGVLNIWLVALALYGGAALGDTASYWVGRGTAGRFRDFFSKEGLFFTERNYRKAEEFFQKFGPAAAFFSRIAGPFSWVTPFLCGAYRVPYPIFLRYNVPGVLVGVSMFLVPGYFFGSYLDQILSFTQRSASVTAIVAALAVLVWFVLKKWVWRQK